MSSILDKLVGDEGVKTDLQISVPPATFLYFGVALFFGLVASNIVSKAFIK